MLELELYENLLFNDEELPAYVRTTHRTSCGQMYTPNWHEQLELFYVMEGQADIHLNNEIFSVRKGDLVIANSNTLHQGECTQPPYYGHLLILDVADFSKELAEKNNIYVPLIRDDPIIQSYFQLILDEFKTKKLGYKALCRGVITWLLVYLSRNYVDHSSPTLDRDRQKKNRERLKSALRYIDENYHQPITVTQLAELVCLSKDRFGHLFQEAMGQSPLKYINGIRLRKAMRLLQTGDYTVTEVADAVGFQDYNHFGQLFRKFYGTTPNRVRLEASVNAKEIAEIQEKFSDINIEI